MKRRGPAWAFPILVLLCASSRAEVRLAAIFNDNMVLQREKPVTVWGRADADGQWQVSLDPMDANASPRELAVKAPSGAVTLRNVLVGEAWLLSGQSNMELPLSSTLNSSIEGEAAKHPNLRCARPAKVSSPVPEDDLAGRPRWVEASPKTVKGFPGTGYFFGQQRRRVQPPERGARFSR